MFKNQLLVTGAIALTVLASACGGAGKPAASATSAPKATSA